MYPATAPYEPGPCPTTVHGSQEIMRVGLTERETAALALGGEMTISRAHFASNVIAQGTGNPYGFVKVVWREQEMAGIAAIGANLIQLSLSAQLLLMGRADLVPPDAEKFLGAKSHRPIIEALATPDRLPAPGFPFAIASARPR